MKVKVFAECGGTLQASISNWLQQQGPRTINIVSTTQSGEYGAVVVTIFYT